MPLAFISIVITILVPLSAAEYLMQYRGGFDVQSLVMHQPVLCVAFLLSLVLSISLLFSGRKKNKPTLDSDAGSDALSLLHLLQAKGRFLDFVMEKIEGHSDDQIVGASRAVHSGCREVILNSFAPKVISDLSEGEKISDIADLEKYKFVGKVGKPPFSGTLNHPGWVASKVEIPRISKRAGLVIAPAEVEVE